MTIQEMQLCKKNAKLVRHSYGASSLHLWDTHGASSSQEGEPKQAMTPRMERKMEWEATHASVKGALEAIYEEIQPEFTTTIGDEVSLGDKEPYILHKGPGGTREWAERWEREDLSEYQQNELRMARMSYNDASEEGQELLGQWEDKLHAPLAEEQEAQDGFIEGHPFIEANYQTAINKADELIQDEDEDIVKDAQVALSIVEKLKDKDNSLKTYKKILTMTDYEDSHPQYLVAEALLEHWRNTR